MSHSKIGPSPLALATAIAVAVAGSTGTPAAAQDQGANLPATNDGGVSVYAATAAELRATSVEDIANARPMPLPTIQTPPVGPLDGGLYNGKLGTPGHSPGRAGDGKTSNETVPVEDASLGEPGGVVPQEFGTANQPYSTARVDTVSNNVSRTYPYSAAGKLYFKDGSVSYVCTASLIKTGVIVTAAHCAAEFGQNRFYKNFQFVPAKWNTKAPFGKWLGVRAFVMTSYLNGTDDCSVSGIVCANDVAVIVLKPTAAGAFPGARAGWLGYGWNGYGFTPNNLAAVSQLGYPVSHDSGNIMQRTDSQGFVSADDSNNTVWGSRQTGGSSGGPEIVNLGINAVLDTPLGKEARANNVIGVTSWGYISAAIKQQGASPFTSKNIVPLVNRACAGANPACQ